MATSGVVRNYRLQRAASFLKQGYNSSETAYKAGFLYQLRQVIYCKQLIINKIFRYATLVIVFATSVIAVFLLSDEFCSVKLQAYKKETA